MTKFKFGIVFLASFASISLATGFYFLKRYPFLSIIFFIAALINSILFYIEYYHQKDTINFNKDNTPEEIKIRYLPFNNIITILTYSIFPATVIFGLIVSKEHFSLTNLNVFMIAALFIGMFIITSYFEIKKNPVSTLFSTTKEFNWEMPLL